MNLLSYNIRGSGISAKLNSIRSLIISEKIDICMLQETKILIGEDTLVKSLWSNKEAHWSEKG